MCTVLENLFLVFAKHNHHFFSLSICRSIWQSNNRMMTIYIRGILIIQKYMIIVIQLYYCIQWYGANK